MLGQFASSSRVYWFCPRSMSWLAPPLVFMYSISCFLTWTQEHQRDSLMAIHYFPIFLLFLSSFCKSDDQLTHAKPLTHGDKLISRNGVFALGFFSPTSSTTSLYLGIWYHSLPGPRTVVWVANRDRPTIAPSSPMLAITKSSDLVLSDSQGRTPWAVKNTIISAGVTAVLLDIGNFVLQFPNGTITWQSFDHPTDTVLPNMRFLVSYKGKVGMRLVAWKGRDDPSSGDFSSSADPSSPGIFDT